jgi:transcriptional regulator with XRE-family HTH domain
MANDCRSGYGDRMGTATSTNDDFDWSLGDRMDKARRQAGITVAEMARLLQVDVKTVGNWTADRVVPTVATIGEWARITGQPVERITGGRPPQRRRCVPAGQQESGSTWVRTLSIQAVGLLTAA